MKRLQCLVAVGFLGLPMLAGQDTLAVTVNGTELTEKALVRNGVSYVPVKALSTALGGAATSDGKTLSIQIPPTTSNPTSLWSIEGAWLRSEAVQHVAALKAWADKAETLLDLVAFDEIKYEQPELTDARKKLREAQLQSLSALKTRITYCEEGSWTLLITMAKLRSNLEGVCDLLVEFREDALTYNSPEGLPSTELMVALYKHGVAGLDLENLVRRHLNALLEWYSEYPGPPGVRLK